MSALQKGTRELDVHELTPTTCTLSLLLFLSSSGTPPGLIFRGFKTHPPVPTNIASLIFIPHQRPACKRRKTQTCIPVSCFCQFKLTTCDPFRQNRNTFMVLEVIRVPLGNMRRRWFCAWVIRFVRETGRRERMLVSDMLIRIWRGSTSSAR